jgi:hypothetical protein
MITFHPAKQQNTTTDFFLQACCCGESAKLNMRYALGFRVKF